MCQISASVLTTPRLRRRLHSNTYTQHVAGTSFGTKFEGLQVSFDIPKQIAGLYHAGSVGIIMSGWLGAMNYGRMVASEVDNLLATSSSRPTATVSE